MAGLPVRYVSKLRRWAIATGLAALVATSAAWDYWQTPCRNTAWYEGSQLMMRQYHSWAECQRMTNLMQYISPNDSKDYVATTNTSLRRLKAKTFVAIGSALVLWFLTIWLWRKSRQPGTLPAE